MRSFGFKQIVSIMILFACLVSFTACGTDPEVPYGMTKASDDFCDYALFIPEEWVVNQTGAATAAYKSANDPTSVSVMSWALPYADSTVSDWWTGYEEEFTVVFENFNVEGEEDVLLGGQAAKKFTYTGTLGANTYRYTQYAAARGGVLYLLTFTELSDAGIDHSEDFSRILDAFAWTN